MNNRITCRNCSSPASHVYCRTCGQKTDVGPLDKKAFLEEILTAFANGPVRQFFTCYQMILHPGENILGYLNGRRKRLQSPISYFVFSIFLYSIFSHTVLPFILAEKNIPLTKEDISHATKIGDTISLFIILLGMSFIGYFFCGISWGTQNRRNYNFIEALTVFAFIYGTNFILDIPIVFAEVYTPIVKTLLHYTNDKDMINLLTDLPLIAIIILMALNFCRTAGIGWHRYALTVIFGVLYYRFITSHLFW
nr:DUF3667 domain-containing protein [uncultured Mucilaginibacter sp.]